MRPACFLDRDGVIVEEIGYLRDPDQVALIPGAAAAIRRLNAAGVPVVVVTNQTGVARGYFPEARIAEVHARLDDLLRADGAHVDRYYYCPHHPTEGRGAYAISCDCRKPAPGMLLRAAAELDLSLDASFMIGDKTSDMQAGHGAGCRTVLVRTGYGRDADSATRVDPACTPTHIADDIVDAVDFCLRTILADRGGCSPDATGGTVA